MFEFVQNNKIVIKIILGIVAFTFVGFGIGSYTAVMNDNYIADVDGTKIYQQDVDRAVAGQPGGNANRPQALQGLVNRELVLADARHAGLIATTSQLQKAILAIPEFQDNGKFNDKIYLAFLKARHMTAETFQQGVSRDILLQTQLDPYLQGQIVARSTVDRWIALLGEERWVRSHTVSPAAFASQIKVDDAQLKAFYAKDTSRFKTPEAVKLDYVILSEATLASSLPVTEAELAKYYEQHKAEFNIEERRAAHILLAFPAEADAALKGKIKAQADALVKRLRANPQQFATLARQYSQDPGSAQRGGDLGFFARGVMVKPFEDTVFGMHKGQISDAVESPFGYHIIRLDDIKQLDTAALKPQLQERVRQQKAAAKFREMADKLSELAYQHSQTLQPIQDTLKLPILHADWLSQGQASQDFRLANPKIWEAALSDEVLKKHHNSESIDLGNNTVAVIRVTAYRPARQQTLPEVKDQIKAEILATEGAKLALKQGQAWVAELNAGKPVSINWGPSKRITRRESDGLSSADLRAIFAVNAKRLPQYTGVAQENGAYVMYELEKVKAAAPASDKERTQFSAMLVQNATDNQLESYLAYLTKAYPVTFRRQIDG